MALWGVLMKKVCEEPAAVFQKNAAFSMPDRRNQKRRPRRDGCLILHFSFESGGRWGRRPLLRFAQF